MSICRYTGKDTYDCGCCTVMVGQPRTLPPPGFVFDPEFDLAGQWRRAMERMLCCRCGLTAGCSRCAPSSVSYTANSVIIMPPAEGA